jgi:NADH dehydrogenase/NADH:ubiquinone oxidoreductase subunit G
MPKINIDGREMAVPSGINLIEAILKSGVLKHCWIWYNKNVA